MNKKNYIVKGIVGMALATAVIVDGGAFADKTLAKEMPRETLNEYLLGMKDKNTDKVESLGKLVEENSKVSEIINSEEIKDFKVLEKVGEDKKYGFDRHLIKARVEKENGEICERAFSVQKKADNTGYEVIIKSEIPAKNTYKVIKDKKEENTSNIKFES